MKIFKSIVLLIAVCLSFTQSNAVTLKDTYQNVWKLEVNEEGNYATIVGVTPGNDVFYANNSQFKTPVFVEYEGKTYPIRFIGERAFEGLSDMTYIEITDNICGIFDEAFAGCTNLKNILLPAQLTRLDKGVFKDCNLNGFNSVSERIIDGLDTAFDGCDTDNIIFSFPNQLITGYRERYPELMNDKSAILLQTGPIKSVKFPLFCSYDNRLPLERAACAWSNSQSFIVSNHTPIYLGWIGNDRMIGFHPFYNSPDLVEAMWPIFNNETVKDEQIIHIGIESDEPQSHSEYYCEIPSVAIDSYFQLTTNIYPVKEPNGINTISDDYNMSVYGINGILISKNISDMNDIKSLPHGIYILKNNKSFKKIIL